MYINEHEFTITSKDGKNNRNLSNVELIDGNVATISMMYSR